jgi:ABC-2 type transport system ATP-binding protein
MTTQAASAIDVRGLERRFGNRQALAGIDLAVGPGEIHALLGPNGAGKTTLLRTLAGLVEPSAGTVRVMGVDAAKGPRGLRGIVGMVPSSDRSAYQRISGVENLAFFARLHGMRKRAAFARAREVLADVGLADRGDDRVGSWSHGMQQRLSVARALLTHPPVLLIDEATHDLDPAAAANVRELVAVCAERGAAVLWATQRLDELRGFAEQVTLMTDGSAAFEGTVEALAARAVPEIARRHASELEQGYLAVVQGAA